MDATLPGAEFAETNGYFLHSRAGDKGSATYIKRIGNDCVYLTCRRNNTATLERIIGLVTCRINDFSYPNKNFFMFESHLSRLSQDAPQ